MDFQSLKIRAKNAKPATEKLFKKLKKNNASLDNEFHVLNDEVFSQINCLECANCCRTLGPRVTDRDIDKISHHLKIKPSVFTDKYLKIDEDNDYVFKNMPCPFLGNDNYCSIYEVRPKACREYPHTQQTNIYQILKIIIKNTEICPAVYEIVEAYKKKAKP